MDSRHRLTLPQEAAEIFEEAFISLEVKKDRIVLKPVKEPFAELSGLIKTTTPFLELRRKLEKDIEEGKVVL
ncbi:hypothetical protein HZC09_01520 [Candidatus Micrarchaeota archaeon]|nr:hypothetical protein [Candidatus Micrarchaeota archaeon]